MGAKLFVIILVIAAVIFGINYISHLGNTPAKCPAGTTFARAVTGGWASTDPTDPWGDCIASSKVNAPLNP